MPPGFIVSLTADFRDASGALRYRDIGLSVIENTAVRARYFADENREITPEQIGPSQGVILMTQRVTEATVARSENLLVMSRFGVGYDNVDVAACTKSDVLVTITVGAVDRPVAEATVGWMIALSHHFLVKDRLTRRGQWNLRSGYMGRELRDRTIGLVGFGGIGRSVASLLKGFGPREIIAFDPYTDAETASRFGARLVPLDELLRQSEFVSIHCPLNARTRGLIGAREIGLMRGDAWLINTARGGIVDEVALAAALRERRIAGAAIDCFAEEPLPAPHAFSDLDNVLLAPHSIAWTDELFRDMGRAAFQTMVDLSRGIAPRGVLNPEVLSRPSFIAKWQRTLSPTPAL